MTVNELNKLTSTLIKQGHGDKKVLQCYDCNYAYTDVGGGDIRITDDAVMLADADYPFKKVGE